MDTFNPVKYSREENAFLLENVGKSPIVALNNGTPEGVNPRAVRPILQEVYDREELKKHDGAPWVGIEALKEKINDFLTLDKQWESAHLRSRGRVPRFPTLYGRDAKGSYHFGAPGSDSGQPTWYEKQGQKVRFELDLSPQDENPWVDDIIPALAPVKLILDESKHRIECPICNHTESFKEESRASYNAARARMAGHLKKTTVEPQYHMELWTNEYGG